MNTNEKLKQLRKLMVERGIDAYIVNTADPHLSEYVHDHYKTRVWISGFTGSAGTALITKDKALLWADGRYFIQAEAQIKDSEFELMKMATPGYPKLEEWIVDNLKSGNVVGFDGLNYSQSGYEGMVEKFSAVGITVNADVDLIGEIWVDRPALPCGKTFILDEKYTGCSAADKLKAVREKLKAEKADAFVIGTVDDIAWLLNVRGADIPNNPVVISYALITEDSALLFVDKEKLTKEVRKYFRSNQVEVRPYEGIFNRVKKLGRNAVVYLDKSSVNHKLFASLPRGCKVINKPNITMNLKAIKNDTEIANQRIAYVKDGVALVKYFIWLEENVKKGTVTENNGTAKLLEFRKQGELFCEDSFDTISAYGPNGAMMHYSEESGNNATLREESFYLVDSGGQYYNGTTDITRTIMMGNPTKEEITDYTLTLKGVIDLSQTKFLYGMTGHALDAICRAPLWAIGSDYKCGTGHGIGFMLNVHEGPQRIATVHSPVPLEKGMITSVEPGVYKQGKYGIRIENAIVVQEAEKTESGQFMCFETLTRVPIDTKAVDKELLGKKETEWLNDYHRKVYEDLAPHLNESERKWLEEKTKAI